jgi:hypothetical protein
LCSNLVQFNWRFSGVPSSPAASAGSSTIYPVVSQSVLLPSSSEPCVIFRVAADADIAFLMIQLIPCWCSLAFLYAVSGNGLRRLPISKLHPGWSIGFCPIQGRGLIWCRSHEICSIVTITQVPLRFFIFAPLWGAIFVIPRIYNPQFRCAKHREEGSQWMVERDWANKNMVSKDKIQVPSWKCGKSVAPPVWRFLDIYGGYPTHSSHKYFHWLFGQFRPSGWMGPLSDASEPPAGSFPGSTRNNHGPGTLPMPDNRGYLPR